MNIVAILKTNLEYIKTVNECDNTKMSLFIDRICECENAFTSKLFIWNILRSKEFYKTLSHHVIELITTGIKEENTMLVDKAEIIIKAVVNTAKNDDIKRSFIWNITKKVPLLTIDTIKYMSRERVVNMLNSDKELLADEIIQPFIARIQEQHKEVSELRTIVSALNNSYLNL